MDDEYFDDEYIDPDAWADPDEGGYFGDDFVDPEARALAREAWWDDVKFWLRADEGFSEDDYDE